MSTERRWLSAAIALVFFLGCGETFKPASYVDRLRILAIQAEPPEVAPAGSRFGEEEVASTSRLRSLVADPAQLEDPDREVSVLYLGCTPDPREPFEQQVCTSYAMLQDPAALAALLTSGGGGDPDRCEPGEGGSTDRPLPISFLGGERCSLQGAGGASGCAPLVVHMGGLPVELPPPTYTPPDQLRLEELPSEEPVRVLGLQATVVAIALVASGDELLEGIDPSDPCTLGQTLGPRLAELFEARESLVAVKRIQVRGPDAKDPPNLNPSIAGISVEEIPLPEAPTDPSEITLRRGRPYRLRSIVPDDPPDLRQPFTRRDVYGRELREEEEERLYSWFATGGTFESLRVREPDEANRWVAPTGRGDDPIPESGRVLLYSVARDLRGGVAWAVREVLLP